MSVHGQVDWLNGLLEDRLVEDLLADINSYCINSGDLRYLTTESKKTSMSESTTFHVSYLWSSLAICLPISCSTRSFKIHHAVAPGISLTVSEKEGFAGDLEVQDWCCWWYFNACEVEGRKSGPCCWLRNASPLTLLGFSFNHHSLFKNIRQ